MLFTNSASKVYGDILDHEKFRAAVTNDGTVCYVTAGKTVTHCILDMRFPLTITSTSKAGLTAVKLVNTFDNTSSYGNIISTWEYHPNGQWNLIKTGVKVSNVYFSTLKFVLSFKRKPLFECTVLVVPVVLLSFLMVLLFMLPVDSGEKVSLEITIILSFTVFQLVVADSVPNSSDYVPIMSEYNRTY